MPQDLPLEELIFVAFNRVVVALDRETGEKVWQWKPPKGSSYIGLLVDGDRLIVSAQGYTYCLDPLNGAELWRNDLEGLGIGVPCLASVRGSTNLLALGASHTEASKSDGSTTSGGD
jgi:outer membrane protein assembly factor BamB